MRRGPFYGWIVAAGAFVSHFLSYGVLTVAFGVFFPFMAEALSRWRRAWARWWTGAGRAPSRRSGR